MEQAPTDKQIAYAESLGIEDAEEYSRSALAQLIDEKKENKFRKEVKQPKIEKFTQKKYKPKFDTSSYYVSYAKDIVCAMIEKTSKSVSDADLMNMMGSAIAVIKLAQQEF